MKTLKSSLLLVVLIACSSCAKRARIVVDQAVGPARLPATPRKGEGNLVVFSAFEVANSLDSDHPAHTRYTICNPDGKILRRVDNRAGPFYQGPATVSLPAGTYNVEAKAVNDGLVLLPVVIQENKTTVVDLDGSTLPRSRSQPGDEWVRLPDGQVIGHKSDQRETAFPFLRDQPALGGESRSEHPSTAESQPPKLQSTVRTP